MKYSSQPSVPSYSAMLSVCCLGMVSYTISLTLGVKVLFSCCCHLFCLLHFSLHCSDNRSFFFFIPSSSFSLLSELPLLLFLLTCPLHQKSKTQIFHSPPIAQSIKASSTYFVVHIRSNDQIRNLSAFLFNQ